MRQQIIALFLTAALIVNFILFLKAEHLNTYELKKVFIVSKTGKSKVATENPKFVKLGDDIKLFCVIEAVVGDKTIYFTEAGKLKLKGKQIPSSRIKNRDKYVYGNIKIEWFKVEPYMLHKKLKGNDPECRWFKWYTNAHIPECKKNRGWIGYDTIEYKEIRLKKMKNRWIINADAHPTYKRYDINNGLGVMRYKVVVSYKSKGKRKWSLSSPGKESTESYGIKNDVFMVNFRKNDSYLGWLSSYFNVPGVFGSTSKQVDGYIGVDCADLVVAGYKKATGRKMKYTHVNGLIKQLKTVIDNIYLNEDGYIVDSPGKHAKYVKLGFGNKIRHGDVIFFDYPAGKRNPYGYWNHVGIIYADKSPKGKPDGILNEYDLIFHAGFEEPHLSLLNDSGFVGDMPTRIMIARFK